MPGCSDEASQYDFSGILHPLGEISQRDVSLTDPDPDPRSHIDRKAAALMRSANGCAII
jgi:hypothetical protein